MAQPVFNASQANLEVPYFVLGANAYRVNLTLLDAAQLTFQLTPASLRSLPVIAQPSSERFFNFDTVPYFLPSGSLHLPTITVGNGLYAADLDITNETTMTVMADPASLTRVVEIDVEEEHTLTLDAAALLLRKDSASVAWEQIGAGQESLDIDSPYEQVLELEIPDVMENTAFRLLLSAYAGNSVIESVEVRLFVSNQDKNHNVVLRIVHVTPEWMGFASRGGWTEAAAIKESEYLKYYEATIWKERNAVHLYALPNDFHWDQATDEEYIAYRESFVIARFEGMPEEPVARSSFLLAAFEHFSELITALHPDADQHLMYSGHGAPDGQLFEGLLSRQDSTALLANWRRQLGRRLGVVDMGGPCNKGSILDLGTFCQHARYYVASDLPNGGYVDDDWTIERYNATLPELQYHLFFAEHDNLRDVLTERIDLKRQAYLYARNGMTSNRILQANYLYSCAEFERFIVALHAALASTEPPDWYSADLLAFLESHEERRLIDLFPRLILHRADNRDFFEWPAGNNGLLLSPLDWY